MGRPDKIGQLLAGSYIDPDSKKPVRVETKSLIILPTLKGAEYQAVKDLGFGRRLAVVSDVATLRALADPLRLAILRLLRDGADREPRAWAVRELARALDEPQTKLYRHVRQLEEQGLIQVAGPCPIWMYAIGLFSAVFTHPARLLYFQFGFRLRL